MPCRSALLISPHANHLRGLASATYRCGLRLLFSAELAAARPLLARERFALIFCSDELHGSNIRQLLQSLRAAAPGVPVVVFSERADCPSYMEAMSAGAFDYLPWPPDAAETERVVRLALAQQTVQLLHSAA